MLEGEAYFFFSCLKSTNRQTAVEVRALSSNPMLIGAGALVLCLELNLLIGSSITAQSLA